MNTTLKTLRALSLIAAFTTFSAIGHAADPAKAPDSAAPAAQAAPAPAAAEPSKETPLHEVGSTAAPAPAAPAAPSAPAVSEEHEKQEVSYTKTVHGNSDDNMVAVMGSVDVLANERCEGNAVSVMGPLTVDGAVDGNAVAVMGANTINGTVRGNVVAVMGVMKLGPKAHVDGNVVCVGGTVEKDPSAYVGGNVVSQARGLGIDRDSAAASWFHHGLRLGRPLAFGPHLSFLWILNTCLIAFYMLLALAFPNGVTRCADTLAQRPGITFLTGILAMLGLPVLFILLLVTVVGIPVALVVLPISVIAAVVFGKSAIYSFVGRSVVGRQLSPALAVLVGVLILIAFYFIPFLGFAIWFLVAFLGFACAITTLFTSSKPAQPKAAAAPSAPPVVPPVAPVAAAGVPPVMAAVAAPAESVAGQPPAQPEGAAAPLPPPVVAPAPLPPPVATSAAHVSEASLPKVGFWIRMVALLIDVILVAIFTHKAGDLFLPAVVAYGALLWKFRGATVGDIIFGIKVVKVDGSALDWTTAIVRALACLLSLVVACLGFFWIAFDPEKQGWHDKIAGTYVVKLPKGTSLV